MVDYSIKRGKGATLGGLTALDGKGEAKYKSIKSKGVRDGSNSGLDR